MRSVATKMTKEKTRQLIRFPRGTETMTYLKSGSNKTAATLYLKKSKTMVMRIMVYVKTVVTHSLLSHLFFFFPSVFPFTFFVTFHLRTRGPFLERPDNFSSGPKANFKIKTCWMVAQFLADNPVNSAPLIDSFIVLFSKYWSFDLGMQIRETQNTGLSRNETIKIIIESNS